MGSETSPSLLTEFKGIKMTSDHGIKKP